MIDQDDSPAQEDVGLKRGVILRSTGSWYQVSEWETRKVFGCRAGGRMRLNGERSTNPLAVGDIVRFEANGITEAGLIIEREERKNAIIRRSVNLSKESHVVASNLDRAFLIATVSQPSTSTGFIDRFLVTAEAYGIPTTIVFNKCDLAASDGEDAEALQYMKHLYETAGYDVLLVVPMLLGLVHFWQLDLGNWVLVQKRGHNTEFRRGYSRALWQDTWGGPATLD